MPHISHKSHISHISHILPHIFLKVPHISHIFIISLHIYFFLLLFSLDFSSSRWRKLEKNLALRAIVILIFDITSIQNIISSE